VIVLGTLATAGFELAIDTITPPAAAGWPKMTVPCTVLPDTTLLALRVSEVSVWAVVVAATLFGAAVSTAVGGPDVASALAPTSLFGAHGAGPGHGPKGPHGDQLDAAAEALGISTDELETDVRSGKTIAQIASDKGIDVNVVIDAMVASAQTELREHVTDLVNNGGPGHGPKDSHGPKAPKGPKDKPHDGPKPDDDESSSSSSSS